MKNYSKGAPKANVTITKDTCLLCGTKVIGENILVNGSIYHTYCYDKLTNNLIELEKKIKIMQEEINNLKLHLFEVKRNFLKATGFINKLKAVLGATHMNKKIYWQETQRLESEIRVKEGLFTYLDDARQIQKNKLRTIYDYWPSYPPDWEERTTLIKGKRGICEICEETRYLHVHHRIKISNGGNHTEENLIVLCESCHGELHNKDFSDKEFDFNSRISSFSKKLNLINTAMSKGKNINFEYRKFNGERSKRTVSPRMLMRIGNSLCITGYCYLRNDKRTFAIRRMSNVKIIDI